MKKQFIIVVLILISTCGSVLAQYAAKDMPTLKADIMFNSKEHMINHRHLVHLPKGNKMVIELFDVKDYEALKQINDLLKSIDRDIAFYKDSLDNIGTGNMRIDYVFTEGKSDRKIRFIRYPSNGEAFFIKNGETSKLKLIQDTIRIRIVKEYDERPFSAYSRWKDFKWYQPVQVTFLLNTYQELSGLSNDEKLKQIIDTLSEKTKFKKSNDYNPLFYHSTVFYRPYEKNAPLEFKLGKWENEYASIWVAPSKNRLAMTGSMGVGLIRNTLAPMGEVGVEFRNAWIQGQNEYSLFNLFVSPYFLFSKRGDGSFHTYDAWFVSLRMGSAYKGEILGISFKELSVGAGYLLNPDNQYFKKHTFKAFGNFTLTKGVTLSPEIIATDNFKNIFPALTLKVF